VLSVRADSFVNMRIARSLLLVVCYGGAIHVQVSSLFLYVHFNRQLFCSSVLRIRCSWGVVIARILYLRLLVLRWEGLWLVLLLGFL
jgi:hypothetical protein